MSVWHTEILAKIAAAGGEVATADLKQMFSRKGDGQRFNVRAIRAGFAEWVRPPNDPCGKAYAVRLTEAGQAHLTKAVEASGLSIAPQQEQRGSPQTTPSSLPAPEIEKEGERKTSTVGETAKSLIEP